MLGSLFNRFIAQLKRQCDSNYANPKTNHGSTEFPKNQKKHAGDQDVHGHASYHITSWFQPSSVVLIPKSRLNRHFGTESPAPPALFLTSAASI